MKGMPHFRQYPMGDVETINAEPGEYVVRRNAVNALGLDNMELLNHADGAHGNLNKLIVSADLENKLVQDNAPVKSDVNGYPIANSPVRQRVDATRQMQNGGPISAKGIKGKAEMMMSEEGKPYYKHSEIMSVPASQVGSEGGPRYYLGEDTSRDMMIALEGAQNVARGKMRYSPADSIPQAMVEGYFDEPEAPKKKGRLRSLLGLQGGGPVEEEQAMIPAGENIFGQPTEAMTQRQMSDMLLDMMTSGGVGGTIKGVGKALRGAQMEMFPKKASRALSKSRKKSKKPAKEYRETAEERENRLWPDIDLSYRSGDNRLAERFLEDHGYRPYMGQGSREFTYEYTDKGLKTFTPYGGVKSGIEQKTFTDPTFKVLRDWMGYQEGGVVRGYQQGGEVRDVPSGNWGPKGAYNEALRKAREEDMGSNDLKSLSLLEQLRLINAGTGVEPERLEQLNPERPIKRRESIFDSPDSSEYNMPTLEVDPSDYRTPIMRAPSDNYGGEEIQKDMKSIMPYLKSFGRIPTPIQEKERWLYQRLGVSPDSLPPQLKGLAGRALLQRYGSEVQ